MLRTVVSIIGVDDKVGSMRRSLMRHDIGGGHDLKILVLRHGILMLDHNFTNGRLLSEVKLVNSLVEQLIVHIVQRYDDLCADRFESRFLLRR